MQCISSFCYGKKEKKISVEWSKQDPNIPIKNYSFSSFFSIIMHDFLPQIKLYLIKLNHVQATRQQFLFFHCQKMSTHRQVCYTITMKMIVRYIKFSFVSKRESSSSFLLIQLNIIELMFMVLACISIFFLVFSSFIKTVHVLSMNELLHEF